MPGYVIEGFTKLGSIGVLFEPELRLVRLVYVTETMVTVDKVS